MRVEPMRRDLAIDFVRGAGILMIGVDHLTWLAEKFGSPEFVNPFITWIKIGWSSAAEFFVFFSGYLTGIVYLKTMQTHGVGMMWARAAQRSWHIYVLNLLTLCAVVMLLRSPLLFNDQLNAMTGISWLMGPQSGSMLAAFLGMRFEPLYFEILNLYIVLLLIAPAIVLLTRISTILPLVLSFGIWLFVQVNAAYTFSPTLNLSENFNPFGWQFMFVLGMLAGIHDIFRRLRAAWSHERLLLVSGGLLLLAFLLKALDYSNWSIPYLGPLEIPGFDKPNLGPLQVIHFLVSVVFVMQIIPRSEAAQRSLPMRAVASVGKRSLECFCLSTILVYVAVAIMARDMSFDAISIFIAGVAIVALLCIAAPVVGWIGDKPWRKPKPESARDAAGSEDPSAVARTVP